MFLESFETPLSNHIWDVGLEGPYATNLALNGHLTKLQKNFLFMN